MLFYNKHFYVLEGEMTLFLKSTLLIDENISKIVNDAVSEYNKFYNITLPEDTLVIHILDKTTFKKFCVAKPDFVVGFVMQGKVYICEHESIKDRYDEIEYKKLLRHEIAHAFLNCYTNLNQFIPKWLHEGLAVYLSGQIANRDKSINMIKLFDKNQDTYLYYNGAGIFIKYIIETYKKNKFIDFLDLISNIKSENEVNKCFIKIYNKTLKAMLKDILKCNECASYKKKFSLNYFKKEIYKNIKSYSIKLKKFFECDISCEKIFIKGYVEDIDPKNNYAKINTNLYMFNPRKSYYKLDSYYKYVSKYLTRFFILKYFSNNNIPNWLIEGLVCYLNDELKGMNYNEKILHLLDDEATPILKKFGGGFLISHLIKKYSKEKFLMFLISLKNIKSDSVVNTKFKRVYNKNIKDILNEMLL